MLRGDYLSGSRMAPSFARFAKGAKSEAPSEPDLGDWLWLARTRRPDLHKQEFGGETPALQEAGGAAVQAGIRRTTYPSHKTRRGRHPQVRKHKTPTLLAAALRFRGEQRQRLPR